MKRKKLNNFYKKNFIGNGYHSRFYHQYFEDWSERAVRMSNGKVRLERLYTGDYYEMFPDKAKLWKWKLTHCVLGCSGMFLFLYGASRETPGNLARYAAIVQMFSLFCILWNIISLIRTFPVKRQMTVREYKITHIALKKSCMLAFVLQELTALLTIISGVSNQNWNRAGILGAGAFLLNGCIYLGGWLIDRKAAIRKISQRDNVLEENIESTGDSQKENGFWFRMGG